MRLDQFFGPQLKEGEDEPMKILAVQSSKGGVGKTLLSFLAAEYLHKRDERNGRLPRVVTIDLDFTGTSIPECGDDSRKYQHQLDLPSLNVSVLYARDGLDRKPVEILTLFKRYLSGHDLREQVSPEEIRMAWGCPSDRGGPAHPVLHITSGEIQVGGNAEFMPNVLFDALHARMLADFLFDLFGYLECWMRPKGTSEGISSGLTDDLGPLWLILDNAPGQSELMPVLQEKLLLWGRHRANSCTSPASTR